MSCSDASVQLVCVTTLLTIFIETLYQLIARQTGFSSKTFFSLFFCGSLSFFVATSIGRTRFVNIMPSLSSTTGKIALSLTTAAVLVREAFHRSLHWR
jgi:hypothetical protein